MRHGAEGTYLFKKGDFPLADGSKAEKLYVFPKYHLEFATQRKTCMLAMLHLAIAAGDVAVEAACASRRTGTYDFRRHMYLRRAFVSVFVLADGTVVDMHKHFLEGGGWSEHQLFVKFLQTEGKQGAKLVVTGPAHGVSAKKRKFKRAKRSVALNRMLRAPGAGVHTLAEEGAAAIAPALTPDSDVPVQSQLSSLLPFFGDGKCIGRTQEGKRCTKPRKVGMFCKQHEEASSKSQAARMAEARRWTAAAKSGWARNVEEAADLAEGKRRSLEMDGEIAAKRRRSLQILSERLGQRGLERTETVGEGDCVFIALVESAGLSVTHAELRAQICNHLADLPELFSGFVAEQFEEYVAYMRLAGSWGDHLCLVAAAHLLHRPIHVVSDHSLEEKCEIVITPPETIAREAWGEPVVVAHHTERHYETTVAIIPEKGDGLLVVDPPGAASPPLSPPPFRPE